MRDVGMNRKYIRSTVRGLRTGGEKVCGGCRGGCNVNFIENQGSDPFSPQFIAKGGRKKRREEREEGKKRRLPACSREKYTPKDGPGLTNSRSGKAPSDLWRETGGTK